VRRALLTVAIAIAIAGSAWADVRSRTSHGTAVAWPYSCVQVQPDTAGTSDLPIDKVIATVQKSAGNWTVPAAECSSYLQMNVIQPQALGAHYDGTNVVTFIKDSWCPPNEGTSNDGKCFDPHAAAITLIFFIDKPGDAHDGALVDADVLLNNVNFTFVNVGDGATPTARTGTQIADLENTLTHELGHLQGLDHTCKDAATSPNEVDDTGNPPPLCSDLKNVPFDERVKIITATMYNSAAAGEISKRQPKADDYAGICAAYPPARDPKVCKPIDLKTFTGGCAATGDRGAAPPVAVALALGLAFVIARRRRA
jgi:uncharacterized protein (TIGR03382 family)